MASSLSNLVDNLAEGIHKIKYDCDSFLEYESVCSFSRFSRILDEFLKLNPHKAFSKVRFAKIITCEKISKSQNFAIFPPLEDPEIWFKQNESWSSKYINYSSTIVFLRPSFFDLQFCDISPLSLDFTSFISCWFFYCRDFSPACFPSFASERKVPTISSFLGSI